MFSYKMQNIFFSEHLSVIVSVDFKFSNFSEVLLKTEATTLKCSEKEFLGIVESKCTLFNIFAESQRNTCDGDCFNQVKGF